MEPMRYVRAVTLGLEVLVASLASAVSIAAERPNVLLILADDMGFSDTSPYGSEIFTPNIARLAHQGMMLTNFHVAAYCTPTRGMLLTGVDNHVVGFGNMIELASDNQRGKPGYEGFLNGRAATIATLLRDAGYHTFMAGKWHLGKTEGAIPAAQGFDESVGLLEGGADNYENKSYSPGYKSVHFFDGPTELALPQDFYSSEYYADRMIGYIDEHAGDGKPFFGYLAFQAVHQPHQAPRPFTARYVATYSAGYSLVSQFRYERLVDLGIVPPGLTLTRPPIVPDWNTLSEEDRRLSAKQMAVYAGMLEYMDLSIGRVLDHLRAKGILDNTVVIFMSDNGGEAAKLMPMFPDYYKQHFDTGYEHLGEKGSYSEYGPGWASTSMTPFSNFKGSAAEGGVRAPFVIRYPSLVRQDVRSDAFAYVLDVVPTILDLAGVADPQGGAAAPVGVSMRAVLSGKASELHAGNEPIGYETAGGAALYRGDYKLTRSAPPYGDGKWRLFNLRRDPTESNDLSAADPELLKSMSADYATYAQRNGVVEVPDGYDVIQQARANAAANQ